MTQSTPKITIAIDGFSSTGKSTVAKRLAKELGYIYVDTGAMYRAITLYALQNTYIGTTFFNTDALLFDLENIQLSFKYNEDLKYSEMYLNNINVEKEIRSLRVSKYVSLIAAIPGVREVLVKIQRDMGKKKGIVMDGRDIGSVVFPNAELKIFLTADAKVRAERRYLEYKEKGILANIKDILKNVLERDHIDSNRKDSPLLKVIDAKEIDATHIDKEEQFQLVLSFAREAIGKSKVS